MGQFDPYFDYSLITEEMVTDVSGALGEVRAAGEEVVESPSRAAVERMLRAHDEMDQIVIALKTAIWTIPVLVHIAGEVEDDPDDGGKIQRCQRCKSPLAGWRPGSIEMTSEGLREFGPDDNNWHAVGTVVAKAVHSSHVHMYYIEDRPLEAHEHECVGLPHMEG